MVHGAATGWYTYPFLDVADLGYPRVLANIVGLVLVFLILELSPHAARDLDGVVQLPATAAAT